MSLSPSILLIDDDASIRKLCNRMLERMGYSCLAAGSGEEGLGILEEESQKIQGVLLDLQLPDLPGEQIAAQLRESHPDLPVLFFTGSANGEQTHDAHGNVCFYVKKPFTRDSIRDAFAKAGVPAGG